MKDAPFSSLQLSEQLQTILQEVGYSKMTPIQALGIPPLLEGKDVIGQSHTGSGKTAAFAIPLLEKVDTTRRNAQVLVICPTRELCQQVAQEVRKLGRYKRDLRVVVLSGGHPVFHDRKALEHGAQIIVGTPGRLIDHIARGTVLLTQLRALVLDEADRMLDMGFRDKIEEILKGVPKDRQMILFSATFPPTIEGLSKRFQKDPVKVVAETPATELPRIEQICLSVKEENKIDTLYNVLQRRPFESVLVFCNLKVRVDEVVQALRQRKIPADRLHGNLEQDQRERVMAKFRNHSTRVLVATDVAARGIDVAGLDAVINYDLPNDPAQYVHRIGRTGRAGAAGLSVSFVTPVEGPKLENIARFIQKPLILQEIRAISGQEASVRMAEMHTLSIGGGRKDKLRKGDILGALTGEIGLKGPQIGKIEILDRVSFVAIDSLVASQALSRLVQGKIKGRRFQVQRVD